MNRVGSWRLATVSLFTLILSVPGLLAQEGQKEKASFKLAFKPGKTAVAYTIDRSDSSTFERNGEENTTKSSVKGKISVASTGENQIAVNVMSLAVKREGTRGEFSFDLKKAADGESEAVAAVRKFLSEPIKVTIEEGSPRIAGPEIDRQAEGARDALTVIQSLRSNVNEILGAGLHAQELVVGQIYGARPRGFGGRNGRGGARGGQGGRRRRPGGDEQIRFDGGTQQVAAPQQAGGQERPRRRGQGQGRGQGRFGGGFGRGFGGGASYRFDGVADGDHGKVAKFTMVTRTRNFRDREAEPTTTEVGKAMFSVADGLLISLKTESKSTSPEGSPFSFKRESRASVSRAGAQKKEAKKAADL